MSSLCVTRSVWFICRTLGSPTMVPLATMDFTNTVLPRLKCSTMANHCVWLNGQMKYVIYITAVFIAFVFLCLPDVLDYSIYLFCFCFLLN